MSVATASGVIVGGAGVLVAVAGCSFAPAPRELGSELGSELASELEYEFNLPIFAANSAVDRAGNDSLSAFGAATVICGNGSGEDGTFATVAVGVG